MCRTGFISLPMRRVHDDVGRGSVEEVASISDHPRSHDGGGGGRRSTHSEELFRWVHIGEKLDHLFQIDITWPYKLCFVLHRIVTGELNQHISHRNRDPKW